MYIIFFIETKCTWQFANAIFFLHYCQCLLASATFIILAMNFLFFIVASCKLLFADVMLICCTHSVFRLCEDELNSTQIQFIVQTSIAQIKNKGLSNQTRPVLHHIPDYVLDNGQVSMMIKKRVGVVGYGHLGRFLVEKILSQDDLSLAFVWNRTVSAFGSEVPAECILTDLENFTEKGADLIVEVAHPSITSEYGEMFLKNADYMIGSPTALASAELQQQLYAAAQIHGLYVPSGALWGGEDIRKMADRGTLQALKVTMTKHPSSFKLEEPLKSKLESMTGNAAVTLFDGPVRDLCPLAPNNVNTMAAAAVAAHNLGFDKVQGSIIADPGLMDWHIVEVEVWGPGDIADNTAFYCKTVRRNPAKVGHVTGTATYNSFLSSMMYAHGKGGGFHLC